MTEQKERRPSRLIERLNELAATKDRGALAALRRGAGKAPGTEPATFPYVVPFIPPGEDKSYRSWPYFCVASLFSLNPRSVARNEGFGTTYRRLKESDSRDARFRALINAHEHDMPKLLRQAIRQLAADETPLNWDRLLNDLKGWGHPNHYVQQRWAREYWAPGSEEDDTD